ncbi:T9SS type A sorting domain-containing protein [Flavobacterium silvisoli]|uniref:T9SS type A sorting domain-containing protein n=1 Tax=Flavobacterium silvisoli TaxID=2529433 RepID=A0A4Q9Z8X6_9FLAO|nr:T9SS type A sorting domain-containing protein [Flavobacterium silvisoli]TBX70617.1 T9SS type A sorting domain-containing protein [Flavobacterium silvisoli]
MKQLLLSLCLGLYSIAGFSQFFEGFENTYGPDLYPTSVWTLSSGNWAFFSNEFGIMEQWKTNNTIPYQGANAAYVSNENIGLNNTGEDYLITPLVDIPMNGQLKFWSRTFFSGNQGTLYQIRVAPMTASQTDIGSYTVLAQFTENELSTTFDVYEEKTINLSAFSGQGIYIAFVRVFTQPTATLGGDCWLLDNVSVEASLTSNCPKPTQLVSSSITPTSAVLNWNETGNATAWEVFVSPPNTPAPLPNTNGYIVSSTIPFVVTGLTPNTCYTYYVRSICSFAQKSDWSGPSNFCTYDCTNNGTCYDNLNLVAFVDSNNNGIKDLNENDFNYGLFTYEINNSGTPTYGYPNNGAYFVFDDNPTNSYSIHFDVASAYTPYFSSSTNYTNIIIPGGGSQILYFPITQLQSYEDLEVTILPSNSPRPGFTYINYIRIKNNGPQNISTATLTFTKASAVSIINVSQSGVTMTPIGFTYTFNNLAPNQTLNILVNMQVPTIPSVNLGDILTNTATVSSLNTDAFPLNNNYSLSQILVGSYDPNDKSESHGGKIGLDTFTDNDYLYYTIQFENTGTANAEFIRIEDTLDASLDESTFEMIRSSHAVNTTLAGNQLTWHFYNINLPPTISQPDQSHGYVFFKIKPKTGYVAGDIIPNSAAIYFDYNPPIVTNTFNTEFFSSLGNSSFAASESFNLYPNPTKHYVKISLNANDKIDELRFYDVSGKMVKSMTTIDALSSDIDVSTLEKGIYFVELKTKSKSKQIKKLIIQ